MTDLEQHLKRLGLSQYYDVLVQEGFDTWATVLDITESDLNSLNFKLGHRRKLQRAIAESRGQAHDRPLPPAISKTSTIDGLHRSDESGAETRARLADSAASTTSATGAKRRYRRHPKPDENAPERPPSAYVIFSNQVREALRGQDLSFTEIAKVVGERWQVLPPDARDVCERQANAAKEKYYTSLAEYKKTPQYEAYQKYLEEFRAKHPPKGAEGKRSKIDPERTRSTRSKSPEHTDRLSSRRFSVTNSEPISAVESRAESTPPFVSRLGGRPQAVSTTSPAIASLQGFNSPRFPDQYSPLSASPRSGTLHKEATFDTSPAFALRDSREVQSEAGFPLPSQSAAYFSHHHSSTAPTPQPSLTYGSHYQTSVDLHSRRPYREPFNLPPLTHEDRSLSSDSGVLDGGPTPPSLLPILDGPKALRLLPQPVPSIVQHVYPDRSPPFVSPGQSSQEYHASSSLAAVLRTGELVDATDEEALKQERPS